MTVRRVIVVCNAMDDALRVERGIGTDSPAASRKVFMMCRALRSAGVRPIVVSLGRGRQDGSGRYFGAKVRRVLGVPVLYAAFWHRALLSQLLSILAPAALLWRIRRLVGDKVVVFYNRMPAYAATLLLAWLLGLRRVLDLEDGEVPAQARTLKDLMGIMTRWLFERLCDGGALLACSALERSTRLRPVTCYYGTAESRQHSAKWPEQGLTVLMGGTVSRETGANLLVGAISQLRKLQPAWAEGLNIAVTGKGDSIDVLGQLAQQPGWPRITVHGRTSDVEYRSIVDNAQVGLALKPRSGPLANTTFPSKVVELASAGQLVLTTDISDVRALFDTGAVYLLNESEAGLIEQLKWSCENRDAAQRTATLGMQRVLERCDPLLAGRALASFLFRTPA